MQKVREQKAISGTHFFYHYTINCMHKARWCMKDEEVRAYFLLRCDQILEQDNFKIMDAVYKAGIHRVL